jgi:FkbM family methyltransferase
MVDNSKNMSKNNISDKIRDWLLASQTKSLLEVNERIDQLHQLLAGIDNKVDLTNRNDAYFYNQLSEQMNNRGVISTGNTEVLVKLFNGLKIYLDTRDLAVATHIAMDGIWEPTITKAWISTIRPNYTIFDIGANFGYFGLLAAHKTDKKNSKIVFIEANPNLIPYIHKTIDLNWYNEQSLVENFAASDRSGTIKLNILKNYIGSSSVQTVEELEGYMHHKMRLQLSNSLSVKAMSIDEYCKKHDIKNIDLIKMDIEGYEETAYAGMREMVAASPDLTLFIEFTKDGYNNPKEFYEKMLNDFGNVYLIDNLGRFVVPKNSGYEYVIGDADNWVMPVFSKNKSLYKLTKD